MFFFVYQSKDRKTHQHDRGFDLFHKFLLFLCILHIQVLVPLSCLVHFFNDSTIHHNEGAAITKIQVWILVETYASHLRNKHEWYDEHDDGVKRWIDGAILFRSSQLGGCYCHHWIVDIRMVFHFIMCHLKFDN